MESRNLFDRDDIRFHGRDERLRVQSFYEGQPSSTKWSKHFQNPQRCPSQTSTNSNPIAANAGIRGMSKTQVSVSPRDVAGHQLPIFGLGKHLSLPLTNAP